MRVANASFEGSFSAAMKSRFRDVENLFGIPAYLKPRVAAAADAAGLSLRDYVVKVFTDHA